MRKPHGPSKKTTGYVLVPLSAGSDDRENIDEAIQSERFDAVVDVLNAMREHDNELADFLRDLGEQEGLGKPINPSGFITKIQVIRPQADIARVISSITTRVTDKLVSTWDVNYGRLKKFRAREGHCLVPQDHIEDGFNLGIWCNTQRTDADKILPDRKDRLNALGFNWDVLTHQWEAGFAALKAFHRDNGHCLVPDKYEEDGINLGNWVKVKRSRANKLSSDRKNRLNELGFVWDVLTHQWEAGFAALKAFHRDNGHCLVPSKHDEDGFKLGIWVSAQRSNAKKLSLDRKGRLNALGFVWDVLTHQWEAGFAALKAFHRDNGHCLVPKNLEDDGINLGNWVTIQRTNANKMLPDRKNRLNELGFVWDPLAQRWEKGFAALQAFHKRHDHCFVPNNHEEDGFKLGVWVGTQRSKANKLSSDRKDRLNELRFVWDTITHEWEEGFAALKAFHERHGHCLVSRGHKENELGLNSWVSTQRSNADKMLPDRRDRLNELGFIWDPFTQQWEQGFAALKVFHERHGHCLVPAKHNQDGFKLGTWVGTQRSNVEKMSPDRKDRLNALGFVWSVRKKSI